MALTENYFSNEILTVAGLNAPAGLGPLTFSALFTELSQDTGL